jgi:hypothetical protein
MAELRNDGKFLDAWDVYAHIVIQSITRLNELVELRC